MLLLTVPPDHDLGDHVGRGHLGGLERQPAVVDQDHVAGGDVARQALVRRRAPVDGALDVVDGDGEGGAVHQGLFAVGEATQPDLRPLQVSEHADRPIGDPRRLANVAQVGLVIGIVAVTHVQPGDIHARGDQFG